MTTDSSCHRRGSIAATAWARGIGMLLAALALNAAPALGAAAEPAPRPNILIILADDLGFSDLGAFGGEIDTPSLNRLAETGLRMTEFHTAAACSPTRAMLMSGIDHHPAGIAAMVELRAPEQVGKPGYEGYLSQRVATLPELLRDAGYETIISGKWHLGVEPDQDPAQRGFEKSFASLPAGNNHFGLMASPGANSKAMRYSYTENGKLVDSLPKDYYSSNYFTDRLLGFLKERDGKRPFFAYLPFTAPHSPLQAPPALIEKYRGRYDAGWNVLRRERLQRQQQLGLLPPNAQLDEPATLLDWNSVAPDQQRYSARNMEIYAAMVDNMDWNIGRVLDHLRATGELDNTVVIFFSDNGAEGGNIASQTFLATGQRTPPTPFEQLGTAASKTGYGPHWAQAATAPRRLFKANATQGALISPTIIRYPGFARAGQIDRGLATAMDILPTALELAGVEHPGNRYRGRDIEPLRGKSMVPYLTGKAERVHAADEAIGWELFGQRAVRQDNWKIAWVSQPNGSGSWELYDLAQDPGERHDIKAKHPAKFNAMLAHWDRYAKDNKLVLHELLVSPYNAPVN
jgi:arylsulfatase